MYLVIGVFAVLLMLTTVTYAFFNYTRTGVSNRISVGRIHFNTSQNGTINLTNAFPITSEEAETDTTNAKSMSISITGDTDYSGGIEYVVTTRDANLSVGTKDIPVTLEIDVSDNGTGSLGTEETGDYYTNRENYTTSKYKIEYDGEIENGSHLLVGYIAPNSTSGTIEGINGVINIKAYLDKNKVKISDTYDGTELDNMGTTNEWEGDKVILTTSEWNSLQSNGLSFRVRVEANEGIWVKESINLAETIKRKSDTASYIASYADVISSNPTFTTLDSVRTTSNKQPVYYYTGSDAAANSNVLFGGYCWQIVRTTDNGGVRLIYNGEQKKEVEITSKTLEDTDITYTNDEIYPYTYDSNTKKWTSTNHTDNAAGTFVFSVKESGNYILNYDVSSEGSCDKAIIYKNNSKIKEISGTEEKNIKLYGLETTDEIKVVYTKDSSSSSGSDNVIFEINKFISRKETISHECGTDRTPTKAIIGTSVGTTYLTDIYGRTPATAFGRSFNYDFETEMFTIEDREGLPQRWSENDENNNGVADYYDLIGTFTCINDSTSCSELYYVGQYYDSSRAYEIKYTIQDSRSYSQLGTTLYNTYDGSLTKVGYMFNDLFSSGRGKEAGEYFATATWDPVNSIYILSDGNGGTGPDATHHYKYDCGTWYYTSQGSFCGNETQSRVIYFISNAMSGGSYFVLGNGDLFEDRIYKLTGNGSLETKNKNANYNLNEKNSAIKGYIDSWYKKNLLSYSNYLDNDAIYCNDRLIKDYGMFNPNSLDGYSELKFNQYNPNQDLNCTNITDRFSVNNKKAKLRYPIGLLTQSERNLMDSSYAQTGSSYWTGSPKSYPSAYVSTVWTTGISSYSNVLNAYGVRPVITLKPSTKIEGGTGTYLDPYIVGPLVGGN